MMRIQTHKNDQYSVLLDFSSPLALWESAIGRVRSACDHGGNCSLWLYNRLWHFIRFPNKESALRLQREFVFEAVRQRHYPQCVSRLTGVFLFRNANAADRAIDAWGVSREERYISPVNFSATKISRHDSNWILLTEGDFDEYAHQYWKGEPLGSKTPLWEYIGSGIGIIVDLRVREVSFRKVIETYPNSDAILRSGIIRFCFAEEGACQIFPHLNFNAPERNIGNMMIKDIYAPSHENLKRWLEGGYSLPAPSAEAIANVHLPDLQECQIVDDLGLINCIDGRIEFPLSRYSE